MVKERRELSPLQCGCFSFFFFLFTLKDLFLVLFFCKKHNPLKILLQKQSKIEY